MDIRTRYIQARMNRARNPSQPGLIGYGTVIIENFLVIKNVRVYEGKDGVFLSFPQRKTGRGYFSYVCCDAQLLRDITEVVLMDLAYQEFRGAGEAEISVHILQEQKYGLLATAKLSFSMGLTITDIKIVEGTYGPVVIFPQYGGRDIVYPLGSQQRKRLNKEILEKYREACKDRGLLTTNTQ